MLRAGVGCQRKWYTVEIVAGVGSQGTGYNVYSTCCLTRERVLAPKGPVIMLIAGVGSIGTGCNVNSGCWLPRDRV
jgi:hypothetical protein